LYIWHRKLLTEFAVQMFYETTAYREIHCKLLWRSICPNIKLINRGLIQIRPILLTMETYILWTVLRDVTVDRDKTRGRCKCKTERCESLSLLLFLTQILLSPVQNKYVPAVLKSLHLSFYKQRTSL